MRFAPAVVIVAAALSSPASSAPAPAESWGKAGVSLAQYRKDALECGLQGHYTDISKTEDAQAFVRGSRELDATSSGAMGPNTTGSSGTGPGSTDALDQAARYADMQQHIVESVRPEERMRNIRKTLVASDQQCLVQRGYSRFVLTDDQRHALRKLKAGSDERRLYLYGLASNAAVLRSQQAPAQP